MDSSNTATSETNLLKTLSNQMADAVERVEPALVLVNGRPRQPASGIVYAPNLVLTADHVLEREEDLTIQTHDKRTLAAQFAGRDLATDLAVLRVADLGLEKAPFASEAARVGQLVMAVGRRRPIAHRARSHTRTLHSYRRHALSRLLWRAIG
jgi:S1-C subfamily serine protease